MHERVCVFVSRACPWLRCPAGVNAAVDDILRVNAAMLTEEAAVAIFVAKHTHTTRDSLSNKLAHQYNITSKSVRDIWNLRTWGWATLPHWTSADKRHFLSTRLCAACRQNGVTSLEAACERCTVTKRRGRPPGIKETKPRNRTGVARTANTMDDDAGASTGGPMMMHLGIPGLFPSHLLLQQQMVSMAQRGMPPSHALNLNTSPDLWNPAMPSHRSSGAGADGRLSILYITHTHTHTHIDR